MKAYDERGNCTSYRDATGWGYDKTYDDKGNQLSYHTTDGKGWVKTYDDKKKNGTETIRK